MLMGVKEIQEIIPHRHPFLLVDCIEELEPGVRSANARYKCAMQKGNCYVAEHVQKNVYENRYEI